VKEVSQTYRGCAARLYSEVITMVSPAATLIGCGLQFSIVLPNVLGISKEMSTMFTYEIVSA
jgi:hypothetical protein